MFRDEIDLFHLYIRGNRNKLLKLPDHLFFFKAIFQGILWDLLRSLRINRNKNYHKPDLQDKIVIHADTINNFKALSFLSIKYPEAVMTCTGGYVGKREDAVNLRYGYSSYPNLMKYLFLLYLYFHPKYGSKMIQLIKLDYFYPQFYRYLFQNNQPQTIFISNDHTPSSRGLMLAAKKMGIKTVYFQHASVTEIFPPLRFDFAFLYGAYSQKIYRSIGNVTGKVFTVGNLVFDPYEKEIMDKKPSFRIGVAYNSLDQLSDVEFVISTLESKVTKYEISLRPHPADGRKIPFKGRFSVSDSQLQSSLDYLKEMDIVIAGNTSFLLEAACMNVLPIQYDFSDYDPYLKDYYGFIHNGLAIYCGSIEEIIEKINDFESRKYGNIRRRAMIYDASIGSEYEFNVKEKIFSILDSNLL